MNQDEHDHLQDLGPEREALPENESPPDVPQAPPLEADGSIGDEVMDILAGVEKQVDRLRQAQHSRDAQLVSLAERSRALDERQGELEARTRQLQAEEDAQQQQREDLAQQTEHVQAQKAELENRQDGLEQQAHDLEQRGLDLAGREEDLERQWDEYRGQCSQFEEQRRGLSERETDFANRQEDLNGRWDEFNAQRSDWEQQRSEVEAAYAEQAEQLAARESELQERLTELEKERERVEALDSGNQARRREMDEQAAALDARRAEIQQRAEAAETEVAQAMELAERCERELLEKNNECERLSAQFTVARQQREEASEEAALRQEQLEAQAGEIEQLKSQLQDRAAEMEARRADLQQRAEAGEAEAAQALELAERYERELLEKNNEFEQLSAQFTIARQQRDEASEEAASRREQLEAQSGEIEQLESQLQDRAAVIADYEEKLRHAGRKLSGFAEALAEQAPQLERGAAALAMVDQQEQQIERLTRELAEARSSADPEELNRKDRRIAELTGALRQARGQTAGGNELAGLEQRNAELVAETDRLRLEVESAGIATQRAREQLKEHLAQAESQEARRSEEARRFAELDSQNELLTDQLRLQEQLLEEARAAQGAEEVELCSRIETLEKELAEARALADEAKEEAESDPQGSEQHERAKEELRGKAERIALIADHLSRRKQRLEKVRALLRDRPSNPATPAADRQLHYDQMQRVEEKHRELFEVKEMLAASEQKMIRKWARQRAVTTFGWIVVLAGIIGAAGWLATDHYFPATISASVVMGAESRNHQPLGEEDADKWRTWHSQVLGDEGFRATLAKRLADRRLDAYATTQAIGARLDRDLTIDIGQTDRITLTLAGTDEAETAALLDVLASTLVQESKRQSAKRSDGAWAVVDGARKENGHLRYATVNNVPVTDDRLLYFAPIFGGAFLVSLLIISLVYARLVRAKRIFDEEGLVLPPPNVTSG